MRSDCSSRSAPCPPPREGENVPPPTRNARQVSPARTPCPPATTAPHTHTVKVPQSRRHRHTSAGPRPVASVRDVARRDSVVAMDAENLKAVYRRWLLEVWGAGRYEVEDYSRRRS